MSVVEQGLEEFNTFMPACLAVAQSCCFGGDVEPSNDGGFRNCIIISFLQRARGYNCHSEGLAEESQCLVANASNFALTPPQCGRLGGGQPTQQDKHGGVAC